MKSSFRAWSIAVVIVWGLAGCVATANYQRGPRVKVENSTEIGKPRAEVWRSAVPKLAGQFFVINNMDQASGLINLSYAGDPEPYLNCGQVTIQMEGVEPVTFPAARAQQRFAGGGATPGSTMVDRTMHLEGRINLIFQEMTATSTRVTATTRYVVTQEVVRRSTTSSQVPERDRESVSFNTNLVGTFRPVAFVHQPRSEVGVGIECHATGAFERDILNLVK